MPTLQMGKLEDLRSILLHLHSQYTQVQAPCFQIASLPWLWKGLLWGNLPSGVSLGCYLSLPVRTSHLICCFCGYFS